ncbi:MAG: tripartite tricarboxylate transporter substrate-binding protein [Actinomycetes bacterium]
MRTPSRAVVLIQIVVVLLLAPLIAQAPTDGYTIGFAYSGTYSINPSVYTNMPFTQSDFASIIWLSTVPMVIVVPTSLPVTSVTELIALAKARPGQLNYGSAGIGSINHLAGELFNMMSGTMISHVPYRGGSLATTALISGEIQLIFAEPASVLPFIESGRIRPIAVTSAKPSALLPGLPTVSASGVAGYDVTSWNGMLAPAGTPSHVIARLNTELNKIIANAEVRKRMLDLGFEPVGGSPERFQEHIRQETEKWAKVVKATGMKVE